MRPFVQPECRFFLGLKKQTRNCHIKSPLFYSLFLESLLEFPCKWNYRPDHCIYGSNCVSAEESGVYILHGNRGVYHDHKQPAFRAIYDAIRKVGTILPYFSLADSDPAHVCATVGLLAVFCLLFLPPFISLQMSLKANSVKQLFKSWP